MIKGAHQRPTRLSRTGLLFRQTLLVLFFISLLLCTLFFVGSLTYTAAGSLRFDLILVGISSSIIFAFVWFEANRWLVVYFVTSALLFLTIDGSSFVRFLLLLSIFLVSFIVVRGIKDNTTLVARLRVSGTNISSIIWTSANLWWPTLVIIAIGVGANTLILQGAINKIYSMTPIDRYCQFGYAESDVLFPCTEMPDTIPVSAITPLPQYETIDRYIRIAFQRSKRLFLAQTDELPFGDELQAPFWLSAFSGQMQDPSNMVLDLVDDASLSDMDLRIEKHWELVGLRLQRQELSERINNMEREAEKTVAAAPGQFIRGIYQKVLYKQIKAERQKMKRLQTEIDIRIIALEAARDGDRSKIQEEVFRQLKIEFMSVVNDTASPMEAEFPTFSETPEYVQSSRDTLKFALLRSLDSIEEKSIVNALHYLQSRIDSVQGSSPLTIAVDQLKNDHRAVSLALGIAPMCTTRRISKTIISNETLENYEREKDLIKKEKILQSPEYVTVNSEPFPCPLPSKKGEIRLREVGLKRSIHESIRYRQIQTERAIESRMRVATEAAFAGAADSQEIVGDLVDQIDGNLYLGRDKCRSVIQNPLNCLKNSGKRKIEGSYARAVVGFQQDVKRETAQSTDDASASTERQLLNARASMYESSTRNARLLSDLVNEYFEKAEFYALITTVLLVLAAIKSFMYVLATEVFIQGRPGLIKLVEGDPLFGQYTTTRKLKISADFSKTMLTKGRAANVVPRTNYRRQPLTALVPRLVNRCWLPLYESTANGDKQIIFDPPAGYSYLLDWRMKEGEQVVLSFRNFFGLSSNVKFRTIVSFHLSSVLLGRFVFHTAYCEEGTGEGRLLLQTNRKDKDSGLELIDVPLDPLIAWNAHSTLQINSTQDHQAIYVDGFSIGPVGDGSERTGLIAATSISDKGRPFKTLRRFVRTFLVPF